jgi:RimJ/RimL family protein N-acetyltransferase
MGKFPSRDRAAHLEHWRTRIFADPENISRTVLADGLVAGHIGSWRAPDGRRLVGYALGRQFWGRGMATAALAQFIAEVAERPIYAYTADTNIGSQRVLEKNGFLRVSDAPHPAAEGVRELLYRLI